MAPMVLRQLTMANFQAETTDKVIGKKISTSKNTQGLEDESISMDVQS